MDALSIKELIMPAISLNGAYNYSKLFKLLEANKDRIKDKSFILIPNNSEAGFRLTNNMREKFHELGISFKENRVPGRYKDADFQSLLIKLLNLKIFMKFITT